MKTKYKILIVSFMVLSLLTAFAVTSFAYTTSDITYNNNTYSYNSTLNINDNLQIWDCDSVTIYTDNNSAITYDYNYFIIDYNFDPRNPDDTPYSVDIYYDGSILNRYTFRGYSDIFIVINGNYKLSNNSTLVYDNSLSDINTSSYLEYDIYYVESYSPDLQINLLNNYEPNPLDKVNDFLGYLSTSLNKLTTMIITNQILILFIVAVPVISFVIGSFKRIKDAGRV